MTGTPNNALGITMAEQHIELLVEVANGRRKREPVHVEPLGNSRYRVLFTPGLVYGIAAGDEIEMLDDEGAFRVVKRGGNLAVRVLSEQPLGERGDQLAAKVQQQLNGSLDGRIPRGLAFTIPVTTGFTAIEALFNQFVSENPAALWEYGNVYDDKDRPLNWWA